MLHKKVRGLLNATEKTRHLYNVMMCVAKATTSREVARRYTAGAAEILQRAGLDAPPAQPSANVGDDEIQVWTMVVSGDVGLGRARVDALAKIAHAYGALCVTDGDDDSDQDRYLIVVGVTSVVTFLQLTLPSLLLRMEGEAEACTAVGRASYMIGWGHGLAEKIRVGQKEVLDSIPGALSQAARNSARIQLRIERLFPDSEPGESPQVEVAVFAAGWNAGLADDAEVSRIQV